MGLVLTALGQPVRATRLLAAARSCSESSRAPMHPLTLLEYEQAVSGSRAALGGSAFDEAWAVGRALSLDEAIAEALAAAPTSLGHDDVLPFSQSWEKGLGDEGI